MKGFVPNEIIEQIREASDIVEVIGEHVPLKKSGKNYLGLCPFHSEKTPSFSVSPEKQIFHCFGCSEGGNAFSFLMKFSNLSFTETVTQLGNRCGISIPIQECHGKGDPRHQSQSEKWEKYFTINRLAAEFFCQNLLNEKSGKKARDYLQNRNLSSGVINKFLVGYADKSWDSLLGYFRKKKVDLRELEKVGLLKSRVSGTGSYDSFRDRIIFPIFSPDNKKICGFGGRDISLDEKAPKYINSPESVIYNKGEILFGFGHAREDVRKSNYVIAVEGYFDLISLYQHGFKNVAATCGTALTAKQAKLIRRYTKNVLLLFDSDEAGYKATSRGFEVLLEHGLNVKVIDLPENTDPDNFINQYGITRFQEEIKKSSLFIEYLIAKTARKTDLNSLEERLKGLNVVLPFLAKIENSVERTGYLTQLAECFRVSDKSLLQGLRKAVNEKKSKIPENIKPGVHKKLFDWSELNFVRLIVLNPENIEKVKNEVDLNYFSSSSLKEIIEFLFDLTLPKDQLSPQKIVELLPQDSNRKILTELLMDSIEFDNPGQALDDCTRTIVKKAKLKEIEDIKKQRIDAANLKKVDEFKKLDKDLKALQGH